MFKYIKKQWKKFLILIGITASIALGAEMLPIVPDNKIKIQEAEIYEKFIVNEEIQEKYILTASSTKLTTKIKHRDDIKVKIGEDDDFIPNMEISKWSGEVKMKIKPRTDIKTVKKELHFENKKIKYKEDKKEFHFYDVKKGDETINEATSTIDAYELEVVLLEKPTTNIVSFDIETQGLDFFYQPELTQQEKDDGAFRPENVIGSYAVYHESKQGDYTQLGKKNYMTGKAFHIYRPLIVDSASTTVWGILNIENGLLTVEIPQEFLNNAVYPVRHAAGLTFGNTGAGNTEGIRATTRAYGLKTTVGVGGTATHISLSLKKRDGGSIAYALYTRVDATMDLEANTASVPVTETSKTWKTLAINSGGAFISGDKALMFWGNDTEYIYYDSGGSDEVVRDDDSTVFGNNWPDPMNIDLGFSWTPIWSIYATYSCNTGATASDFTYHKSITLEADEIATTTTSFPVLATTTDADLKTTTHGGHINFDDARDLVFLDTDQTTLLDFEIESYATTTGALVAWVDVSISSTTDKVIYMYYGDSDATLNYECASQVYDDNFVMVQHLQETPAGTTYDSTSNDNDGTTSGMDSADQVAGQIDGSLDFDGANDYVDMGTTPGCLVTDSGWTASVWINPSSNIATWDRLFLQGTDSCANWQIMMIWHTNTVSVISSSDGVGGAADNSTSVIPKDVWSNIIWTYDGTTHTLYVNGADDTQTPIVMNGGVVGNVYIGRRSSGNFWDGAIDEVRISNTARSAGWIATEYNNQVSVGSFLTVGSEQTESAEDDPDTGDLRIKSKTLQIKSGTLRIKN